VSTTTRSRPGARPSHHGQAASATPGGITTHSVAPLPTSRRVSLKAPHVILRVSACHDPPQWRAADVPSRVRGSRRCSCPWSSQCLSPLAQPGRCRADALLLQDEARRGWQDGEIVSSFCDLVVSSRGKGGKRNAGLVGRPGTIQSDEGMGLTLGLRRRTR
jgi:hypothetical protein